MKLLVAGAVVLSISCAAHAEVIAHWRFDAAHWQDGHGTPLAGGLDCNAVGAPELMSDELGASVRLDGLEDHLVVRHDFAGIRDGLPQKDLTVAAWVAVDAATRWGGIVGVIQDNGEAETGWLLGYENDTFNFALSSVGPDDDDGQLTYMQGTTTFEPGRWYHVAATYDGRTMSLYVNGVLEATSTSQAGAIRYPAHAPFVLGAYRDANEFHPMNGRLREVIVTDRAQSAETIRTAFDRDAELAALDPVLDTRHRMIVRPYLQNVSQDAITIMWETSRPSSSTVRYGQQQPAFDSEVRDGDLTTIHEVRLTGLETQQRYFYQVASVDDLGQPLEGPVLTFQTAVHDDSPFGFVVMGDTQANPAVVRAIAELAWAQRPSFTVHAGDLVSEGTEKSHWTSHFFSNMWPYIARVPFFPVLGNHERDAGWYYDYMSLPEPEYYYEFSYGNAQYFMLDTNKVVEPDSEQYAWLDERLAASTARWKFIVHHQPAYTSDENDYGNTWETAHTNQGDQNVRHLVPLYEKYNVDIVFNGHIHVYERTFPIRDNSVVEHGGVIYITAGGAGGGLENFAPTRTWFGHHIMRGHHYCLVTINGGSLEFQAFNVDGQLFDTFVLKK